MHKLALVVIAVVGACGDSSKTSVDASTNHDAPGDTAGSGSGSGSASGTAKTHTLFLQLEGVTVVPGVDDGTTDHSTIIPHGATLKPWRMGDASRATEISALTTEIRGILAPYDIAVVTTRPAGGPYHEMIVTDDSATVLGTATACASPGPAAPAPRCARSVVPALPCPRRSGAG
jgi:hypothetical protein